MTRRMMTFDCEGAQLAATLDHAPGASGLLIVSGGNEIRSGAWAGQALLARAIVATGHPVFRFDRRGVGDSGGENAGFERAGPDIAAALAAFRAECPDLRRVIGFGNCDGASALALNARRLGLDALVLANPWTVDEAVDNQPAMAPQAIRARYLAKLTNPREVWRLICGGVNLRKTLRGLRAAAAPSAKSELANRMAGALEGAATDLRVLLATSDRTAQLFAANWPDCKHPIDRIDSASHSFSDEPAQVWLRERLLEALAIPPLR